MKHIKLFEEFTSNYVVPDSPIKIQPDDKIFAEVKGKYKRWLWMHDIDKETGNIKLRRPYGGNQI